MLFLREAAQGGISSRIVDVFIWVLIGYLLFHGLGAYPLSSNNERLYAAISSDMLARQDLVIPQLAGLPYLEKPPLLFWSLATSFALLCRSALAARVVPAAAVFITALCLYGLLARRGLLREARLAAVIFASCIGTILLAHIVLFDSLLLLGMTLAAGAFGEWLLNRGSSVTPLRVAAGGLAVAVLAKGLVALVLFGGIALASLLLEEEPLAVWGRRASDPVALLVFAALALPWHLLATWQQRGFAWFYFINEHVLRFLGRRQPADFHHGPLYFYLPKLWVALSPWSWVAVAVAFQRRAKGSAQGSFERFSLIWALVPLVFFSLSSAKADYYIVLCLPPLSIWLAFRLASTPKRRLLAATAVLAALVNLVVLLRLPSAAQQRGGRFSAGVQVLESDETASDYLRLGLVGAPLLAAFAFWRRELLSGSLLFGFQSAALSLALLHVAEAAPALFSDATAALLAKRISPTQSLMLYGRPEDVSAALFYCRGDFKIVDSQSPDFDFARRNHYGEGRIFITSGSLADAPLGQQRFILVPRRELRRFESSALHRSFRAVDQTASAVLMSDLPLYAAAQSDPKEFPQWR